MSEEMKAFLKELADLFDKHDLEVAPVQTEGRWGSYIDSINLTLVHKRDINKEGVRHITNVEIFKCANGADIRDRIERES